MINKLAVAMIVGAMTVLPAAAASAQQSTGTNGVTTDNSGQKPTNKNGLPTNCMAGDTACSKTDPNAAANMNGSASMNGSADMKGTTDMGTTGSTKLNSNAQGVLDSSGNSPKCRDNDATCANTGTQSK